MKRIDISEETLYRMYINDRMSKTDIAKELNIGISTLQRLLRKYNINRGGDTRRRYIDKDMLVDLLVTKKKGKYEVCDILNVDYHTLMKSVNFYNIIVPKKEYDVEKIKNLYLVEHKTMSEIAEIIGGCSYSTINRILHENKVDTRASWEYERTNEFVPINKEYVSDLDVDKLKDMYYNCYPVEQISKELGVSRGAINRKAKELNLKRKRSVYARDQYDDSKDEWIVSLYKDGKSSTEIAKIVGMAHRTVQKHIAHAGYKLRNNSESKFVKNKKEFPEDLASYDSFYDLYVIQKLSKKELSSIYNVSPNVLNRLLKEYGIHKRGPSEALKGLMVGEKHPGWKGGPKELTRAVRNYIMYNISPIVLKRDRHKCQYPGCNCTKNLHVHHIRKFSDIYWEILNEHQDLDSEKDILKLYDIMIHDDRINDTDNLITYCKDCHLYKIHGYNKSNNEKSNVALF